NKSLKHRLQIKSRATDDLEHIGGGGLLLERFAKLAEQASVLNRNDCLMAEGSTSSICLSVNGRESPRCSVNTPTIAPSLVNGTPSPLRLLRKPAKSCRRRGSRSGSASRSGTSIVRSSSIARPKTEVRAGVVP